MTSGERMITMVEPITDEEFLGYFTAMLGNDPWGEPATWVEDLPVVSGSH
jgi:hypothetical protein